MPLLLLLLTVTTRGQSALDGFDPNANGIVSVIVVQPDGKILLGGSFTTLSPNGGAAVTRNHIARLNPDGTLDTAFNPNADNSVFAIALQADGKILAGGLFTGIGGQTRTHLARLDATTGLADSFDPNASGQVNQIVVQTDGKILVCGDFINIGGQPRAFIARLEATTGLVDSFNANANGSISSIAVQSDGKILAGGGFSSIGGQPRSRMARLDATSGSADSFNPNANAVVSSIAVQADGKILAGGFFTSIGGQARSRIARLDATTGLADAFDPSASSLHVGSIVVQADGKILAGGSFLSIGGQTRNYIARLDPTTGLADSFDPKANNNVYAIAVQADGKILAGGDFTTFAPSGGATRARNRIARLETDGRLDQTFLDLNGTFSTITGTAVQPDGKILIGGFFTSVLGVPRNRIARLNTDGTLDLAFNPNADSAVDSIAVQPDDKILVGGSFVTIGGQTRNRIARLDPTTGLADSFNPNASSNIYSIAVEADGKILVGGNFMTVGGQPRTGIARLNATTGLPEPFNANANNGVSAISIQADGKILVSGAFGTIGGQTRPFMARLDAVTGLADSFNPNAGAFVTSIAVQTDGRILASGSFTSIGGQPRNRIARLDPNTSLSDSFDPNADSQSWSIVAQADGKVLVGGSFTSIGGQQRRNIARLDGTTGSADPFVCNVLGTNTNAYSIAVRADGKVLVGGDFDFIGGQTRAAFARLSNDTAAQQNLTVTQTAITWTRGGSSPQLARVTFEHSTDNVNYTPLGSGTSVGSNWTLAGLNLPTGLNYYIRARGYYRSGYRTGSGSIVESIRNVFLPGPVGTPVPTPTPSPTVFPTPTPTPTPTITPTPTATPTPFGGTCQWTMAAPYPIPVTSVAITSLGGNLYAFGGSNTVALNNAYKFDGSTWTAIAPLPIAQSGAWAVNDGTNIYIVGSVVYKYDPVANTYTQRAQFSVATSGHSAVCLGGKIYKVCGTAPGGPPSGSNALEIYDIATNTWTTGSPCPTAATSVNAFSFGAFLYVAGGLALPPSALHKAFRYNPATNAWDDTIADLPMPRYGSAAAAYGGGVVLAGGSQIFLTLDSALFWDPVSNQWSDLPNMLEARTGQGAVLNGSFYVVGGNSDSIFAGSNDNQKLTCAGVATPSPTPPPSTPTPTPTATPTATTTPTATPTPTPTITPGTLGNIATRLRVLSGDNALIGGMIATGTAPKRVILRAIGPTLTDLGVPGALTDPTLELYQGNTLLLSNDDWRISSQEAEIKASGFAPNKDLESAIIWTLTPGQGYTAIVRGKNAETGIGVVEAYDLDHAAASKLGNISTRGFVDVGDNVMIAGLIVTPNNGTNARILVRALGPTLADLGVPSALANPTLDLVNSSGTVIRSNNDWKDDPLQRSAIEAASLAPNHDEEAALVETVAPGAYTAIVRGIGVTPTGVALVEVYHLP